MAKIERVEIEINGKKLSVMPHMIPDYLKLGAKQTKRVIRETPKELLMPNDRLKSLLRIPVKEPLPEMKITKIEPVKPEPVKEIIPEVKPEPTLVKRKSPVKSRSKK